MQSFPERVRQNLGFQLWQLQQGERPADYRSLPSIGAGVFELREQDERAWYRLVYLSRINDVLYVLPCFEKKSCEGAVCGEQTMKDASKKPTHVTHGNVLDDLGFPPEQATALKFKAELYQAVLKVAKKYSQRELQIILGEPQPRVSELLNGKIANKSVDKLLAYAGRLGIEAKAKFAQTRKAVVESELALAD